MSAWSAAIAAIHTELASLNAAPVRLYGHEPGNPGWQRPQSITVSMGPLTEVDYGVTIRVYQSTNTDLSEAQTSLTDLVLAVEALLGSETPRSTWQTVWLADDNAWMCSTTVLVPRLDF